MASKTPHVHAGSACPSPPISRAHRGDCPWKEGAIPQADASKVGPPPPAVCPGRGRGHIWDSVASMLCPPRRPGPSPARRYSTIPHADRPGWDAVPRRPRQGAAHPPTAWSHRPPSRREGPSSPRASGGGCCPHGLPERGPAPTPAVPPPPPGIPGKGGAAPSPPGGALHPPPGPASHPPPASAPEWNVPASPPRVPPPLRRSGGSTGPRRGEARRVHSGSEEGRRSGTVTCRRPALRGPGRLRGHGPRLGALRLVRHLQLHGRARGPAGGCTRAAAAAAEQQPPPAGGRREGAGPRERGAGPEAGPACAVAQRARRQSGLGGGPACDSAPRAPPSARGVEGQRLALGLILLP